MNAFREWLNTLFGSDGGRAVQMILALIVVVLLLLAVAWLFRRLFSGSFHGAKGGRLSVVDATSIDHHRRLVLLRRDDVEHLVMIGGPNDVLVESRILRAPPVLAGRAGPIAQPQVVPVAQTAPNAAPAAPAQVAAAPGRPAPFPEAPAAAEEPPKSRVVPGAAAVAAAMATAGAFMRARTGRGPEDDLPPPADLDHPTPPPARATVDTAFDTPLGRAEPPAETRGRGLFGLRRGASEANAPAEPPLAAVEPPRPVAVPPSMPPLKPVVQPPVAPAAADVAEERHELAHEIERALGDMAAPPPSAPQITPPPPVPPKAPARPAPRNLDEIDLLADLDLVVADLGRPTPVEAPPVASPRRDRPERAPERRAERPPEPPRLEPGFASSAPIPLDDGVTFTPDLAPPVRPTVARAAPTPEPVRAPEPPLAAPAPVAVESPPPEPEKPRVDELEEEMARLLSELSGTPRR